MISVDASALVEINKLRFVGASCFKEIEVQDLALFLGVDDAESGVDLFAEALDGVYLALVADRALNVVVVGRVKIFLDHIGGKGDLADAIVADHTFGGFRQIEGKISRAVLAVAHNEGVEKGALSVNGKVAVGSFVLDLARGSPKLAVIGKSYFDKLNEGGLETLAIADEAVNATNAGAFIFGFCVIVVDVAVKQREFITLREILVAENDRIAVRNDIVDTVELEGGDGSHIFLDRVEIVYGTSAL